MSKKYNVTHNINGKWHGLGKIYTNDRGEPNNFSIHKDKLQELINFFMSEKLTFNDKGYTSFKIFEDNYNKSNLLS